MKKNRKVLELLRELILNSASNKSRSLLHQLKLPEIAKSSHHFLFYQRGVQRNTIRVRLKFHYLPSFYYAITFLVNIFHLIQVFTLALSLLLFLRHHLFRLHVFIFLMLPHKSFSEIKILVFLHSLFILSPLAHLFSNNCIGCCWMQKSY